MNHFVWAMLWRETRSSWRRWLLFFLSIAAGVGGLVAVKSFSYGLEEAIHREARTLLAADLKLHSHRPFTDEETAALADLERGGAKIARITAFTSMARGAQGQVHLVQIRAVGAGYPFYGQVLTASGRPFGELLGEGKVLVEPALLTRFKAKVGDRLQVGWAAFTIAGVVTSQPDRPVQIFSLGPGVMMTEGGGRATGLIGPTSRIHFEALVKLPPESDPRLVANRLKERLPDRFASVRTYDESQPTIRRFLGRLTDYLNLVGLAALILGGIGVAGAIRVFLGQKLDTLAILKCLGATSRSVVTIFLAQAVVLGFVGSLAGTAFGLAVQGVLARLLTDFLPVPFSFSFAWRAIVEGVGLGLLTTVWFALPPLLRVRSVPPARVFRRDVEPPQFSARGARGQAVSLVSALLLVALLVVWQVGPGRIAAIALGGLVATFVALQFSAWALLALLRRLPKPSAFVLKQGLASLYRPGNQTAAVVVSLGLGVLLVLEVFLIQNDLLRQVTAGAPSDQPNLIFIDLQKDQRADFRAILARHGVAEPEMVPIVRGRLRAINGQRLRVDQVKDRRLRRTLTFEYSMTYRDHLLEGEQIVEGAFAPGAAAVGPQVSAAEWWAENLGMEVGDTITMNIQGIPVRATINSVRRVDWANRRPNFSLVFLPGALEDAPQTFISAVSVAGAPARAAVQREVVEKLANVSVFDVETIFVLVQRIMDRIGLVIQFMAGFSIAVALVTLFGTIATTKFQRIRETVLYKTLGATRSATAQVLATEYLLLGAVAGLVGALAAGGVSWGLVTYVFEGDWRLNPAPYLAAWALTMGLITFAGLASSLDVLLKKPLQVLREE